jgi:DNA-binding Lrp family transcriptional regulator
MQNQTTAEKIIEYIQINKQATGNQLAQYLKLTPRAIRKQLKKLYEEGVVTKIGNPPKVFYRLNSQKTSLFDESSLDIRIKKVINDRYLYISPAGDELVGLTGFVEWCKKTNQNINKTAKEYIQTLNKYDSFKTGLFINGLKKLQNTFPNVYLNELKYLDFYSIERFGKTKLGQLLLYAKQSQNKQLIRQLTEHIKPQIQNLIKKYHIDGIVFVPPTVKRETQLMFELEKNLLITIRTLKVTKVKTPIIIPQKTLSKLQDRISNAEHTIIVEEERKFTNILIVDDAVGSGATMNEVAKQIKNKNICLGKIIGLAITGSFKGFDVISEV